MPKSGKEMYGRRCSGQECGKISRAARIAWLMLYKLSSPLGRIPSSTWWPRNPFDHFGS